MPPIQSTYPLYPAATGVASTSDRYRRGLKRLFDLLLLATLAPLIVPVVLLLALPGMIAGAPFYGHVRVGRDGRRFTCWKLRTMVRDADAALVRRLQADPHAAEQWRRYRKLTDDPRITRLGRLLRRTSLDELPQLLNVLRGEMSLVGPRPLTAEELQDYGAARQAYLHVLPGITGLWQVSGRNALTLSQRAAFDMQYAHTLSLWLDLRILLRTARVVLQGRG
ncbi:sugar transferase [Halovulum marinum]|nr:sugar transferase [Halovulum marinum]